MAASVSKQCSLGVWNRRNLAPDNQFSHSIEPGRAKAAHWLIQSLGNIDTMTKVTTMKLDGTTKDIAGWIWHNLVPKSGQAATVQGELLRAVEKLCWEAQNNGNGNWDKCFEMFIDFMQETLGAETGIGADMHKSIRGGLKRLRDFESPYLEDDLYDRLTDAVVEYCRLNPVLVKNPANEKQYR